MRSISIIFSLLVLTLPVHPDHIRGPVTQEIPLKVEHDSELSLEMTANELTVLELSGSTRF
jgi:hypothetical protein